MVNNLNTLLNETEVAKSLNVSLATVRRWRVIGQGPQYRKIGASVRYDPNCVSAWLESRHIGGGQTEATQKKKSPAGANRRTSKSNTFTPEHIGIERVFASCVHELLLQTPQIAFCDLRARVRDWATRGELVAALGTLLQADFIQVTSSIAGPLISLQKGHQ